MDTWNGAASCSASHGCDVAWSTKRFLELVELVHLESSSDRFPGCVAFQYTAAFGGSKVGQLAHAVTENINSSTLLEIECIQAGWFDNCKPTPGGAQKKGMSPAAQSQSGDVLAHSSLTNLAGPLGGQH